MKWRKIIIEILINIFGPWLVYHYTNAQLGEINALILSMLLPFIWSIFQFIKEHKLDILSVLVLVSIIVSLVFALLGGGPIWILLRESLITGFIGITFLVSLFWRKPLTYYLALATRERISKENANDFKQLWNNNKPLAIFMRLLTLMWGIGLVVECLVRIFLLKVLSVEHFLIIGPIIGYSFYGGLTLATIFSIRRYKIRYKKQVKTN